MNITEIAYLKGIAADRLGTSVEILEEVEQFLADNEQAIKTIFPNTTYYN